jgi:hypothetical protein
MRAMRKYWITLLVESVLTALIAYGKDIFAQTAPVNVYHILCDSFFVVGTVTLCAGLLVFSSNEGTFDMLMFGVRTFVDAFRKESVKKYDTFYDYRVSRQEKKLPYGFLMICGLIFLAVAFVMYYLYRQYV